MKKNILVSSLIICLVAVPFQLRGSDPAEGEKKPHVLMRKKLELAQNILSGLANEDFDAIRKNAKIMNTFVRLEQWLRADQPTYRAQLDIFRHTNDELVRLADEKNLDGAALAYVQLTVSCVNCHKVLRDRAK